MAGLADSRTHVTLLQRLAQTGALDQGAWAEFVTRYGGRVFRWCLRWGLQDADAHDVTQQVLLKLARRMKTFTYDPDRSFRAWLKTVTQHALHDFETDRQRCSQGSGDSRIHTLLDGIEARADLVQQVAEEYDRDLLQQAMLRVRLRVAPHTWEAFVLTALETVPAAEVARRLEMKVATVYKARSSVLKLLQEERRELEQGLALETR